MLPLGSRKGRVAYSADSFFQDTFLFSNSIESTLVRSLNEPHHHRTVSHSLRFLQTWIRSLLLLSTQRHTQTSKLCGEQLFLCSI